MILTRVPSRIVIAGIRFRNRSRTCIALYDVDCETPFLNSSPGLYPTPLYPLPICARQPIAPMARLAPKIDT